MKFILRVLLELIKAITYKWLLAIITLASHWIRICKLFLERRKRLHGDTNATNTGCGQIDHPSFHRPDPLIYSQKYLLKLGLAVTWDNPDIILLRNGVVVSESDLLPNTEYEIDATIWNNSFDAPVVAMKVNFNFLTFGAATTVTFIDSTFVDVGVKGGANHPAHARVKWITPPAGHYCIQVDFACGGDLNPENNIGQNNINVITPQSPAVAHFDVRNPGKRADDFRFEIDTYTLPTQHDCPETIDDTRTNDQKWEDVQRRHRKAAFPIPAGWTVTLNPDHVILQPDATADIEVKIEPPANFTGQQPFNINAVSSAGKHVGGVTLIVSKP
jgi:hypothetical protein